MLTDEEQRARANSYPHMCRMDHVQIGHRDSENENCPLCVALSDLASVTQERDKARREALEDAARLLLMDADHGMWPEQEVRKLCAAAIRALIPLIDKEPRT